HRNEQSQLNHLALKLAKQELQREEDRRRLEDDKRRYKEDRRRERKKLLELAHRCKKTDEMLRSVITVTVLPIVTKVLLSSPSSLSSRKVHCPDLHFRYTAP